MAEEEIITAAYKVEIDGKQLEPEMRTLVSRIEFIEEINFPSMFRVLFQVTDIDDMLLKFLKLEFFQIGAEVKLYMGNEKPELMMVGEITSIEPKFKEDSSEIEMRGFDRLHKLKLGKNTKTYLDIKDSDLASEVAGNWGLQVDADATSTVHPHVFQNNLSDYEFLKERADRLRYEIKVEDKKLLFKKAGESVSPELTLEYGADFSVFSAAYNAVYMGDTLEVRGWDYAKKEIIEAKAKAGDEVSKMGAKKTGTETTKAAFSTANALLIDEIPVDESEAEALALAEYNRNLVQTVMGKVQMSGTPALRISVTVKISKLGNFNGAYYIHKTLHALDKRGYLTDIHIRRTGL